MSNPQTQITARYNRLRRCLAKIGFVCKGSMIRRYMPCGQPRCRCARGSDYWHGPYYQWTWKVKGKTVTVRLTREEATLMGSYVRNDRQLRRVVAQMRVISLRVVQAQIKAVSRQGKPRKWMQAGT